MQEWESLLLRPSFVISIPYGYHDDGKTLAGSVKVMVSNVFAITSTVINCRVAVLVARYRIVKLAATVILESSKCL